MMSRRQASGVRWSGQVHPGADGRPGLSPLAAPGIRQRASAGNGCGLGISLA
jgi:hypothetical protein